MHVFIPLWVLNNETVQPNNTHLIYMSENAHLFLHFAEAGKCPFTDIKQAIAIFLFVLSTFVWQPVVVVEPPQVTGTIRKLELLGFSKQCLVSLLYSLSF